VCGPTRAATTPRPPLAKITTTRLPLRPPVAKILHRYRTHAATGREPEVSSVPWAPGECMRMKPGSGDPLRRLPPDRDARRPLNAFRREKPSKARCTQASHCDQDENQRWSVCPGHLGGRAWTDPGSDNPRPPFCSNSPRLTLAESQGCGRLLRRLFLGCYAIARCDPSLWGIQAPLAGALAHCLRTTARASGRRWAARNTASPRLAESRGCGACFSLLHPGKPLRPEREPEVQRVSRAPGERAWTNPGGNNPRPPPA
jgi:hypothetical protein